MMVMMIKEKKSKKLLAKQVKDVENDIKDIEEKQKGTVGCIYELKRKVNGAKKQAMMPAASGYHDGCGRKTKTKIPTSMNHSKPFLPRADYHAGGRLSPIHGHTRSGRARRQAVARQ